MRRGGGACGVIGDREALTDAQRVIADMKIGSSASGEATLEITGAVDHADRRYRVGGPIALSVQINRPAYVAVLRVMPNGATTLIFPNRAGMQAHRSPANSPLRLPDSGDPVMITVDKPGVAMFEFLASNRGDSWLFKRKPQNGADFAELGSMTRTLAKDIVASRRVGDDTDTAFTHLALRVLGD
jgi:hypothetical protein